MNNNLFSFSVSNDDDFHGIFSRGNAQIMDISDIYSTSFSKTPSSLFALKDSIGKHGFLDPILISDDHMVLDGRKRLLVASSSGLEHIPVTFDPKFPFYSVTAYEMLNSCRNYFEFSDILCFLTKTLCISRDEIASRISLSVSAVSNKIRLSSFTPEQRDAILNSRLSERHARALLKLSGDTLSHAIEYVATNNLNVACTEQYVDSLSKPPLSDYDRVSSAAFSFFKKACEEARSSSLRYDLFKSDSPDTTSFTFILYK